MTRLAPAYAAVVSSTEEPLHGGNSANGVVRVGGTVRKPWLPSSEGVQGLLGLLRDRGVPVPEPLGRDDTGRQVLGLVPGVLALDEPLEGADDLARVGALVRRLHEAAPAPGEVDGVWDVLLPAPGVPDLVCHHDLAPWNLVLGEREWTVIDWDGAGPGTRIWDLAYAAQTFARLEHGEPVDVAAARLRAVVGGYDADPDLRRALPEVLVSRTEAMAAHLRQAAATGWQPWARMHADGHGAHWDAAAAYVREHREEWRRALA